MRPHQCWRGFHRALSICREESAWAPTNLGLAEYNSLAIRNTMFLSRVPYRKYSPNQVILESFSRTETGMDKFKSRSLMTASVLLRPRTRQFPRQP